MMGEQCGNVPNRELPSLRPEDINWRPPYSDDIPSWKDISDLAHSLDSMERLLSNPLLVGESPLCRSAYRYPEKKIFVADKISDEINDVTLNSIGRLCWRVMCTGERGVSPVVLTVNNPPVNP